MPTMKYPVRSILIASLCVSQTAGFAGFAEMHSLQESISPFLENANTLSSSVPVVDNLLNSYKHALQVHPLETKMLTGGFLATMGDAIAQSREPEEYDTRRAASFAAFDMAYRALQHNVFPMIVQYCQGKFFLGAVVAIPPFAKFVSQHLDSFAAMEQTLASQLGVVPFLYYPVFFTLTGAVQGLSVEGAMQRAKENFLPLMQRNLLFWIPVSMTSENLCCCNFALEFISCSSLYI